MQQSPLITFPAELIEGLRTKIAPLVELKELREMFGAAEFQFKVLVREGKFSPVIQRKRARAAWDPAPILQFLDWFTERASMITSDESGWEHLHDAARGRRIEVSRIIEAVGQGAVRAGHRNDLAGYAGLFVCASDVEALVDAR